MTELTLDAWSVPGELPESTRILRSAGEEGGAALRYPSMIRQGVGELHDRLAGARSASLLPRRAADLPAALARAGRRFLDAGDPVRREALALLPTTAGLSPPMAEVVLDGMARDWTEERLEVLLRREFPDPEVLDAFRSEDVPGTRSMAVSPPVTLHVGSGNVPGVTVASLMRSLLVKSAAFVKPGRGDVALPLLFRKALQEEDPALAACIAVAYWPGGGGEVEEMERAVVEGAELVVAYGGDGALHAIRQQLAPGARLVPYPHQWSLAAVARDVLEPGRAEDVAKAAARAVALFEQRGCVSPQVLLVESGGGVEPREWARMLARALGRLDERLPPPALGAAEASRIQQDRAAAALRAAAGQEVEVHEGPDLRWTVVFDAARERPLQSSFGRTARVVPVDDLSELPRLLAGQRPPQTVALEAEKGRRGRLAEALARRGVLRLTTLNAMPWPPAWWHHDGRSPLRSLVRWIDLED